MGYQMWMPMVVAAGQRALRMEGAARQVKVVEGEKELPALELVPAEPMTRLTGPAIIALMLMLNLQPLARFASIADEGSDRKIYKGGWFSPETRLSWTRNQLKRMGSVL